MISLCVTNFQRYEMLVESFAQVLQDVRVSEIVISDDCSSNDIYEAIWEYSRQYPKIKLFRNKENLGMSRNKRLAIERATSPWCILFDSDNIITSDYLTALSRQERVSNVINAPESGGAGLDYSRFSKWFITASNINFFLSQPKAEMLLNTCNYFVNRQRYLAVYQYDPSVKGADTIWFNYLWLKAGGAFVVVPGMRYYHRIHPGSGFMQDLDDNTRKCHEIVNDMKNL